MGLHERLAARIDELERLARDSAPNEQRVPGMGAWVVAEDRHARDWWVVRDQVGAIVASRLDAKDATHIATWDPATVLRGLAGDRDILARHRRGMRMPSGRYLCFSHYVPDAPLEDECPEVLSVARRHGINPEEA